MHDKRVSPPRSANEVIEDRSSGVGKMNHQICFKSLYFCSCMLAILLVYIFIFLTLALPMIKF